MRNREISQDMKTTKRWRWQSITFERAWCFCRSAKNVREHPSYFCNLHTSYKRFITPSNISFNYSFYSYLWLQYTFIVVNLILKCSSFAQKEFFFFVLCIFYPYKDLSLKKRCSSLIRVLPTSYWLVISSQKSLLIKKNFLVENEYMIRRL